MFASKTDIQTWLQPDKIQVDDANSQKPNIDATRIVKGALAGMFAPVVIASWDSPDNTPELVRSVTGRLAAAFIHAAVYSEETTKEITAYSNWLYTGAMTMLSQIVSGALTITNANDEPIDTEGSGLLSFFPDNTTTPQFTMNKEFS